MSPDQALAYLIQMIQGNGFVATRETHIRVEGALKIIADSMKEKADSMKEKHDPNDKKGE